MGMILRIASSRIVGQGDIVGRSGYFSLNLSANSVMRGRLDARRTLKSLVADLRYIKVISGLEHEAIDSIPRINGVSEGYQGEELVFSAEGYGMDTWLWEFGESGTVDAYEQQVVYSYDIPGEYTISLQTNTTKYPVKHRITILPRFEKAEELVTVDSLALVQNDIKKHLQAIADAKVSQKSVYYEHTNYIRKKYFCIDADQVVVIINDEKYNDFNGYCQGLHFLESNRKKRVSIDDVKIDDLNCVKSIHVTQSYIEK